MSNSASFSGAFDPAWYLAQNPDVAAYLAAGGKDGQGNPMDALQHWLRYGSAEGRGMSAAHPGGTSSFAPPDASATGSNRFDRSYYLTENPDVAASGMDALAHYLKSGYAEGRGINAGQPSQQLPAGTTPMLNPGDPNSWAGWQMQAHAQTDGLNKMPYMAPQTSQLQGMSPADILAMFYPGKAAKAAPPASTMSPDEFAALSAQAVANLGMGRR